MICFWGGEALKLFHKGNLLLPIKHTQFTQPAAWRLRSVDSVSQVWCAVAWLQEKPAATGLFVERPVTEMTQTLS